LDECDGKILEHFIAHKEDPLLARQHRDRYDACLRAGRLSPGRDHRRTRVRWHAYRNSVDVGATLGEQVADWVAANYFHGTSLNE
jgi:hypothetical protein